MWRPGLLSFHFTASKCRFQIGDQVVRRLRCRPTARISPSPMPSVARTSGRHRGVRHDRRMLDQAFDAAEAFGQREQPGTAPGTRAPRRRRPSVRPRSCRRSARIWRLASACCGWLAGPDRTRRLTFGCCFQPLRDLQRRAPTAAPCAAPASSAPRSARKLNRTAPRSRRTAFCRNPSFSRRSVVVADHRHAADHVGMAVEIFGGRMHHDVEAEFQRPLDIRAGEGVVGDGQHVALARDRRRCVARSISFSSGLVGVSTQIILVFGRDRAFERLRRRSDRHR